MQGMSAVTSFRVHIFQACLGASGLSLQHRLTACGAKRQPSL